MRLPLPPKKNLSTPSAMLNRTNSLNVDKPVKRDLVELQCARNARLARLGVLVDRSIDTPQDRLGRRYTDRKIAYGLASRRRDSMISTPVYSVIYII